MFIDWQTQHFKDDSFPPKIWKFSAILTKIQTGFIVELIKLILKHAWQCNRPRLSKALLKTKVERFTLMIVTMYYTVTVIKPGWHWHKDQWTRNAHPEITTTYMNAWFMWEVKLQSRGKRKVISINSAAAISNNKWNMILSHIIHKIDSTVKSRKASRRWPSVAYSWPWVVSILSFFPLFVSFIYLFIFKFLLEYSCFMMLC